MSEATCDLCGGEVHLAELWAGMEEAVCEECIAEMLVARKEGRTETVPCECCDGEAEVVDVSSHPTADEGICDPCSMTVLDAMGGA